MARVKFTKKIIDELKLPEKGQRFIWDDEVKGLGIRLTPTAKAYFIQARVNGHTRRDTIGRHGIFTLDQARDEARERLRKMRQGLDPKTEKARKKAEAVTLEALSEQYIKDRHLKPLSIRDIRKHVNGYFAQWKDQPINTITRDMVLKRFREISETAPTQANQAFRLLRAMLNFARATYRPDDKPVLPENPCQVLSDAKVWNENRARTGRIPTDKTGQAWAHIQKLRQWPGNTTAAQTAADLTAFIMLTGCRFNEGASLTWDRVHLEASTWHLADSKNNQAVTFPLSEQAQQILEGRPRKGNYVFPARTGKGHIGEIRGTLQKVTAKIGERITAHDLRRGFTAIANQCGIELWKTKLLMNHKLHGDVTLHNYTERADLRYLKPEIDKIGEWIEQQGFIAGAKNVVDLGVKRQAKANG